MDTVIPFPAELGLLSDVPKTAAAIITELDTASILEAIQVRASTLMPVPEEIFRFRPSSHWGINE